MTGARSFSALLAEFAAAGVANDDARFAALFSEDATYDDNFFGLHRGRGEIAAMLQRFHDTGRLTGERIIRLQRFRHSRRRRVRRGRRQK